MSGDFSRISFDPQRDFQGVLLQQGRVHLDSEWNELVAQFGRRFQAATLDTLGRAIVPRETPDGFKIDAAGGTFTIGVGRIYVHGLLAENHGGPPLAWNPVLAEQGGTATVGYAQQPYLKNPPALPAGGPHLVYVDVWQREVTHLQEPALVEKAVGIDTTLRLQTVWQVKVLANIGANVTCDTPLDQVPGWPHQPSAARLSTGLGGPAGPTDPCQVPPGGGYKGLENQLYRIEVHQGGGVGQATFKWSRENASVATSVEFIPALDRLVVESVGRDSVLRFSDGDWVEVTDDWRELNNLAGELRRIKTGGGVDDTTRTIVLDTPLPAGAFPTGALGATDPARHTRIRRWDQKGVVRNSTGAVFHDLDAAASTGAIPIPAAAVSLLLENGVLANFRLQPGTGEFKVGDYWVFAARTADASLELLTEAPPRGIHHHYTKLALVTFPAAETDCRVLWPPEEHEGCDCTVCVTAERHNAGTDTLQHAVDSVKTTGGTVCLGPGIYNLTQPVTIFGAESVRIRGQGFSTQVVMTAPGPAIRIQNSEGVWLERLAAKAPASEDDRQAVVVIQDSIDVALDECLVTSLAVGTRTGTAVVLVGTVLTANTCRCMLQGRVGLATAPGYSVVGDLALVDSHLAATERGVSFGNETLLAADTRIAGNLITGCREVGILCRCALMPRATLNVLHNVFEVVGDGIAMGAGPVRAVGNDINAALHSQGDGIALVDGLDPAGMSHCQLVGNRIVGMAGYGIVIRTRVQAALVKQNVIARVRAGGIVTEAGASVTNLAVEDNQLLDVAAGEGVTGALAGMRFLGVHRLDVVGNQIRGVGRDSVRATSRAGIEVFATDELRVSGNSIEGVGPSAEFVGDAAGIHLLGGFRHADVAGNQVQRPLEKDKQPMGTGRWRALHVHGPEKGTPSFFGKKVAWMALDKMDVLLAGSKVAVFAKQTEGSLAVRGNMLDAQGSTVPAAEIADGGSCVLGENHCRLVRAAGTARPPVVDVRNVDLSATGNRLRGARAEDTLHIAKANGLAVLGNLVSGPIVVDGAPLPAPWAPLNTTVP